MDLSREASLKKMRNLIEKDKETKKLKINDEEVIIVYNYLLNRNKENALGYKTVLETKPYISVVQVPTISSKEINFTNELMRKNSFFEQDLIFLNMEEIQLENFKYDSEKKEKSFRYVSKLIKSSQIKKGCYFYGQIRAGKTFLLKCLFKVLIKKKKMALFIFMPDLVRQFKNFWSNIDVLEKKLNFLKTIPFLFLDDLGSENMNMMFRDEILLPLLNYRSEHQLPIFFSSNFDLKRIYDYLDSFKDFSNGVKALKITKIIQQNSNIYEF
ncbi:hypothetical protein ['Camptotheca acuminata' phytoplasma]|uniref:hypothetical protein n=1 Tax='Camptotheca acuminata' phytoplasma TaxID=3239192 RepID=UPI00351A2527